MSLYFPTTDDAIGINQEALKSSGQTNHALLRPDVLDSALGRAGNHYYYGVGEEPELIANAAGALAHGVGAAQSFEDGNKRTAYWLTHHFLHQNGYPHLAPEDDEELADHLIGHGEGTHSMEDTQNLFRSRLNQQTHSHVVSNILDPIHDTLSPSVFDNPGDDKPVLKDQHRKWIRKTVHEVLHEAGYTHIDQWLTLVLTGSLTTYQYDKGSDCDISLFVDTKHFPEWSRAEMIGLMIGKIDGRTLPGTHYPMQCFVVPPEVKREDLYQPGLRSGYDLSTSSWIVPPERDRAMNVEKQLPEFYAYALEQADKMESLLRYEPEKATLFWHQIHKRRRDDQKAGKGDYAASNIVYKFLANRGLFDDLSTLTGEYIAHYESQHDSSGKQGRTFQPPGVNALFHNSQNQSQTLSIRNPGGEMRAPTEIDHIHTSHIDLPVLESKEVSENASSQSALESSSHNSYDKISENTQYDWDFQQTSEQHTSYNNSVYHPSSLSNYKTRQEVEDRTDYNSSSSYELNTRNAGKPSKFEQISAATGEYIAKIATQDFFTDANQGLHAPEQPLRPEDVSQSPEHQRVLQAMRPHYGPFDEHIETSIPDYRSNSLAKAQSLLGMGGGRLLDIAGSTGAWNKALSHLSGGKWQTDNLDPNQAMIDHFNKTPVQGANMVPLAFGEGFEDNGRAVPKYETKDPYDVVHESMGFQFIGPNRHAQVNEAKKLMKPGGLFLSEQKFHTDNEAENEAEKDQWKLKYHTPANLQRKNEQVGFQDHGPMVDNLAHQQDYEDTLRQHFRHVRPYWQSGNFAGYAASDNPTQVKRFTNGMNPSRTAAKMEPIQDQHVKHRVDKRAVQLAARHLGIKAPVKVAHVGGVCGRYHGLNKNGDHEISVVGWLRPESASKQIWHELTHAEQMERGEDVMKIPTTDDVNYEQYRNHPLEVEAHEWGERNPFPLALPLIKESKIAAPRGFRPQIAKFVYDPVSHTGLVGEMGRAEGENYSHNQLAQQLKAKVPEMDLKNLCFGDVGRTGVAQVFGRSRIGPGKGDYNPYQGEYEAVEFIKKAVPGAKVWNSPKKINDEWGQIDPTVLYVGVPPAVESNAEAPIEQSQSWTF